MNNEINKYMDNNEKLMKNNNFIKIINELQETNLNLHGCKKYYNDNIVKYNNLCKKFPSKLISKLFKYREKEFLEDGNNYKLKILNENKDLN